MSDLQTGEMTPRERWMALFEGRQPDRIPTDYWGTDEVTDQILHDLEVVGCEALWNRLYVDRPYHIDAPFGPEPICMLPHHPNDKRADIWGIRYQFVDYGHGVYKEVVHHPLGEISSIAEVDKFRWPTVGDFDYSPIADAIDKIPAHRTVRAGVFEPFLLACSLRGMQQAFEDLLLQPDIIEAILDHIFQFYYEHNRRLFEMGTGKLDVFYLAEDLGGQTAPLFSLEMYRRFLKPNQIRMAELARQHDLKIFYHTDGSARLFIPDLVNDVGIDVLNPIQWRCAGMDRAELIREFGDDIIFHGAMDNQHTLPFGSTEDIREQVKENFELFARARWICAPCHNIQPNTPTENIVAMYEAIHELSHM